MNIRKTILDKYQVDIDEIDLIKLYKIESADIAPDELEKKLTATRNRWKQSASGTNEKIAARDKARLAKADDYEAILRNKEYLRALLDYRNKKGGNGDEEKCKFAKEFFTSLKGANKTISQKDFNFFMQYFREERKNEKAILEMLKKDFHAITLKASSFEEEEEKVDEKSPNASFAHSRFQKDTVCLVHKAELQYAELQKSSFLQAKYPKLSCFMYDFLNMDAMEAMDFADRLDTALQEVFTTRQNDSLHSNEYIPLSEFYNSWKDLIKRPDVSGNFLAFKKIVQYSKLTPYLYLAENVSIPFLEMLVKKVKNEYDFAGLDNFLFVYFKPLADGRHYSFTMDKKLETLLKKVKINPATAAQEEKRRSAAVKRRKMIPLQLQVLRFFATWPVLLVQGLFEAVRFAIVNVRQLIWAYMIFFTVIFAHFFNGVSIFEGVMDLFMNFSNNVEDVVYAAAQTYNFGVISFVLGMLFMLVQFVFKFLLAPALCTQFLYVMLQEMDRAIDLMGLHKTFQNIQQSIEQKLLYDYKKMGVALYKKLAAPIVWNLVTTVVVVLAILILISLISFLSSGAVLSACI